ncbi:MAG TPA: BREX-1 system phosphatase PglZ type B [Pirellulales bacterium]|nr:BREX-1 system phosphatase PglZ type B [Pirellulales bacterium]
MFDALLASLAKAADHNRDDAVGPAAVLWPDEKREWERLLPRIRVLLPHFLVLGPYDKPNRTGPAIWLRYVLAAKVPDITWPTGTVPIIYLPGVSRATLRATEECPNELKPLAELQYRGAFWSQVNAKDWTIAAFLQTNHGGLQLKIAKDQATATAIRRAIDKLLDVPVADLQAQCANAELNSQFFNLLISDDPVDDLLTWLADPQATRERWDTDRWEAMCGDSVKNYGFDPARDGPLVGAEKLGLQEKNVWKTAWKRFATAPSRYAGLIEQLRRAKPQPKGATKGQPLFQNAEECWPQDNEAAEAELRRSLLHVASASPSEARQTLAELENHHKQRREWVWARLHLTPLANALQHLAQLSQVTETPLTGATLADMVNAYTGELNPHATVDISLREMNPHAEREVYDGWKADAAVLDALAAVSHSQDRDVICGAISQVYTPWLRDAAELFQERVKHEPLPGRELSRLSDVASGTCVLFADGLRYDIGRKLKAALEVKLGSVQLRHQFVALPSVTPTAKPAVSPVADKIKGSTAGEEFRPCVAVGEKELTTDRFRKLLEDDGYQILGPADNGEPKGRAWTEFGNLDKTGHHEGIGLARRIGELLTTLTQRVESLLAAGWREVRIVTDHGWLLVPKCLPKSDLPKYLTATRWGRCAVVKPSATVEFPCFSWFWAADVRIACPSGIDSFIAGKEYSHGGLSLQECVVPQLTIQAASQPLVSARIESYKWAGLRCRVKVEGGFDNCTVDLRDKAADPASSLTGAKSVGKDGSLALVVEYDARDGTAAILVLLDADGNVLEKTPVTVGG